MSRCSSCSQSVVEGQRFCPACGEPQQGVELLDVSAGVYARRTSTTVSRNSSSNRWFVVLALVVAGVVGWSLVSSGGDAGASGDALDDEVGAEESEDPAESGGESTTTQPDDEDDDPSPVDDADDATSAPLRDSFPGEDGEEFEPLLPGSGLILAVGNPLRLTNLDTGETIETSVRASPVAVIGEHLLLRDQNGTRFVSLRLDDLEGELTWLGRGDGGFAYRIEPAEQEGQVWILTERWDTTEPTQLQTRVDLATGEELEERPFDIGTQFWAFGPLQSVDFRTPRSGGVYARDGDGFVRVADGSVIATGEDLLLVDECDDRLRCTLSWRRVDAPTETVDRPLPDLDGEMATGTLIGEDRLLAFVTINDWRYSLFDLDTDRLLVEGLEYQGDIPVSASDDGRYIAYNQNGDATVVDLETATEIILRGGFNSGGVLLINTP